jgi:hypothetical protein
MKILRILCKKCLQSCPAINILPLPCPFDKDLQPTMTSRSRKKTLVKKYQKSKITILRLCNKVGVLEILYLDTFFFWNHFRLK